MNKLRAKVLPLLTLALVVATVPGLILIAATRRVHAAATITVMNANDSGAGSLRQAIADAASGDTINFAGTVTGTIALTSGDIQINKNLTITGSGANVLTVSGNHNSRIFTITGGTAAISGLTLADGNGISSFTVNGIGGAICNRSTLMLTGCTVTRNTSSVGGGIFSQTGTTTIRNCIVSNNSANNTGGGIDNTTGSTLTVRDSAIVNNTASKGGGIYNEVTLTLVNTTVANNVASDGGGLFNFGGLTAINCTITGNRSDFGGGLLCNNNEILQNTIIAGNVGLDGVSPHDIFGTVNSVGHCLIGDAGSAGGVTDGTGGNIVGVNGTGTRDINTILAPLRGQYGGTTPTYLLVCGSPALNAGDNSLAAGITTDQRGAARVADSAVDIGAVEMQNQVTTLMDSGAGSLRQTIADAPAGGIIDISVCMTGTITLTSGQFLVQKDLTINGPGADKLTLSGNNASAVFHLLHITAAISRLTIADGNAVAGAGINNDISTLTLTSCDVTHNTAGTAAGILNGPGNLTLNHCNVTHNTGGRGGGIVNTTFDAIVSQTTINSSTISDNQATDIGGGILNSAASIVINDSTISNNSAGATSNSGGGLYNDRAGDAMTLNNCTVSGNSASGLGGGIYNHGNLTVTNGTITGNRCDSRSDDGGGIYMNGTETLNNSIIAGNFAGSGTTPGDLGGTADNTSHSLVGDAATAGGIQNGANGNIVGVDVSNILNTTLADNGGPTKTHALVCGSPAIDAGDNSLAAAFATDQRGKSRFYDGNGDGSASVDMGAVEKENACPSVTAPGVSVQKNKSLSNVQVATVSDGEDAEQNLTVKINGGSSATSNGVSVSITNPDASGNIKANVSATCAASTASFTLSVTDSAMQTTTATLTVTVTASDPPSFTSCPGNISRSADAGQCSASVSFAPVASDDCNGTIAPVCKVGDTIITSPHAFPTGTTTVTCTATDADNQTATCSFMVTVNDTQAPVVTVPANITKSNDPNQCSAVVTFVASASDNCGGAIAPSCTPPSGSVFAKGMTTVTCTATDAASNTSSKSFTVTVNDTQKPVIACPANMLRVTARPGDATGIVNYPMPTATDNCSTPSVVCTPPTGAAFPLGTTSVSCTATDTSGNTASCGFTITMFDVCLQNDGSPTTSVVWNSQTGDYRFCCGGTVYTGRATSNRRGMTFSLSGGTGNRITGSLDATQNKGNASLQVGSTTCTITDRDIRDNTCQCALSGGS